jgi:hypothetical protein
MDTVTQIGLVFIFVIWVYYVKCEIPKDGR